MNERVFKLVMDFFKATKAIAIINDEEREVYCWKNFMFYMLDDNAPIIVEGKIPMRVLNKLSNSKKYPSSIFSDIYGGGLTDCITSDELECFIAKLFANEGKSDFNIRKNLVTEMQLLVSAMNIDNLYTKGIKVFSKEGLVYLFTELADYLRIENDNIDVNLQVNRQKELIGKINNQLFEASDFDTNKKQLQIYRELIEYQNSGLYLHHKDREIRDLLMQFDKAVNPFICDEQSLEPQDYVDKLVFKNIFSKHGDYYRMIITDVTASAVMFMHTDCSLDFCASNINHRYSININKLCEETVFIDIGKESFEYNLITGALIKNGHESFITSKQKDVIILELKKAIEFAENITIKNMTSNKLLEKRKIS